MRFQIDPTTGIPLYLQLADAIRTAVASGGFSPGQDLPSARDLAAELRVNYHTVRRAFQELALDGVIARQRGGPFTVTAGSADPVSLLADDAAAFAQRARDLGVPADTALDLVADALSECMPSAQGA